MCQVEAVINSRPLTYISSDDLTESLTPFHLLFGRNVSMISHSSGFTEIVSPTTATRRFEHLKNVINAQ